MLHCVTFMAPSKVFLVTFLNKVVVRKGCCVTSCYLYSSSELSWLPNCWLTAEYYTFPFYGVRSSMGMGEVHEFLRPFREILLFIHPELLLFKVNYICKMFSSL